MRYIITSIFLLLTVSCLNGNGIQIIQNGPIHEAFVTQESGNCILQAIPDQPPPPLRERPPGVKDKSLMWIPGYWAWSRELGDYIWVSGVWRRPPSGQEWIRGHWRNYPSGWVWFKGFWSPVSETKLTVIPKSPPDQVNEKIPLPPTSTSDYIWIPGYWQWVADKEQFRWYAGRWDKIGGYLMYTPAQYYSREDGYIFVPGYWDQLIEERGVAYSDAFIPQEARGNLVYEAARPLTAFWIIEVLFPQWPNFMNLFHYHFYFHKNEWIAWGNAPPWWHWNTWWCLPPQDAWGLWWWWSHPAYPNPSWVDSSLAKIIAPPSEQLLKMMRSIKPPVTVTSKGAIGPMQLIDAIEMVTGKPSPLLTSDPKQIEQIQDLSNTEKIMPPPYLRPNGGQNGNQSPPKPQTPSSDVDFKMAPGRIKLPTPPQVMQQLTLLVAFGEMPPIQGHTPEDTYTPSDMQTYHLDDLMTQPQPLRNPPEPKVHPTPGREATQPTY